MESEKIFLFRAGADAYAAAFLAQLDRYGPRRIARRLREITRQTGAQRLVLCCFEPADVAEMACHRRLWAAWWLHQTGERVPELGASPTTTECVTRPGRTA